MRKNCIVLIGAPGVGKGTFASLISKAMDLNLITLGDEIRHEISRSSSLGNLCKDYVSRGMLVPDEIVNNIAISSIKRSSKSLLLDGFPRTVDQAKFLNDSINKDFRISAVNINLEKWVAVKKCLGRMTCSDCKKSFNSAHVMEDGFDMPAILPSSENCSETKCMPKMSRRIDDTHEIISARFEQFADNIAPLLGYYAEQKSLHNFVVKKGIKDTDKLIKLISEI